MNTRRNLVQALRQPFRGGVRGIHGARRTRRTLLLSGVVASCLVTLFTFLPSVSRRSARSPWKHVIALVASLLVTACGTAGHDRIVDRPSVASCAPKVVTLQLFGDSTMYGVDSITRSQAIPSPAQNLQAAMDARFGVGAVRVTLNAVSGTDSAQLLAGTDGLNRPWPQSVSADLVVVNHGINDTDPARGISIDRYEANLRRLVALSPAPVVFETPNPMKGTNERLDAFAQRMRDVAGSLALPVADTNTYVRTVPDWESFLPDYVHPTAAMYGLIVGNSLAPVLVPLVARLRCE
ncbi:MAG: lipolytic protein family [Rhizobacter sp.]|nr:lipolytic protein family [Rhizobacter sp.]